jgi:hypothetical protein
MKPSFLAGLKKAGCMVEYILGLLKAFLFCLGELRLNRKTIATGYRKKESKPLNSD